MSAFTVDANGSGGACPASWPATPSLDAGTTSAVAGAFTAFTLTATRPDRSAPLTSLSVTTPPGMSGAISSVPLCPEPQAGAGDCPASSLVGTTAVGVGVGDDSGAGAPSSDQYFLHGNVYLTGAVPGFGRAVRTVDRGAADRRPIQPVVAVRRPGRRTRDDRRQSNHRSADHQCQSANDPGRRAAADPLGQRDDQPPRLPLQPDELHADERHRHDRRSEPFPALPGRRLSEPRVQACAHGEHAGADVADQRSGTQRRRRRAGR